MRMQAKHRSVFTIALKSASGVSADSWRDRKLYPRLLIAPMLSGRVFCHEEAAAYQASPSRDRTSESNGERAHAAAVDARATSDQLPPRVAGDRRSTASEHCMVAHPTPAGISLRTQGPCGASCRCGAAAPRRSPIFSDQKHPFSFSNQSERKACLNKR